MPTQRSRADLPRLTWETPATVAGSYTVSAALLLPAGQSVASWLTRGRLVWPRSGALGRAVGGLLTGHPGRGVPPADLPYLAPAPAIYAYIVLLQLALAAATGCLLAGWWRRHGPGVQLGMADRDAAEAVLGLHSLRRKQHLIRPDLPPPPQLHLLHLMFRLHRARATGRAAARFEPADCGWRLGRSRAPHGVDLWVPFDRTAGVYGPQGSGKTLDLLTPALLAAPGAALVTLTKVDDLLLTISHRNRDGRPVAVLDPFGLAPGLPEMVWDPIAGCTDSMLAERRAKAFTAGTVHGATTGGAGDDAARFYAAEAAKVLQAFLHAAALTGATLDDVLEWVADPRHASEAEEILRTHPGAARFWAGLLHGALHGDERTAGNTATTVQQAMGLFFQEPIRSRCTPNPATHDKPARPASDITDLIARGGTIYLLGREDPYASASPLLTAVAEHVLDTALALANRSAHGRLCPPFLACLDELPSTAPLPTLRTRMANERALGLSFLYAAQTWRQLVISYGQDEARALFGLTNNVIVFGGGKDGHFYRDVSNLLGTTRVTRTTHSRGSNGPGSAAGNWTTSTAGEDAPIMRPEEIRQLPQRQALVIAENAPPIIADLHRCIDGPAGTALLAAQTAIRQAVHGHRRALRDATDLTGPASTSVAAAWTAAVPPEHYAAVLRRGAS